MSRRIRTLISTRPVLSFGGLLLIGLALGLVGCDADSPSEPSQPPGTPPGTGGSSATYSITINLSPPQIPAGSTDPVQVSVRVVRRDTNQPPPNGTTIVVAAGAGSFGSLGGPSSVPLQTVNGQASVAYFPPAGIGTGTVIIQARLEDSIGQAALRILEAATFFIASVQPNVGNPNGGEAVTIHGGGFETPVRVTFGGVPAQVQSVSLSRIRVLTPPAPQAVPVGSTLSVDVTVTVNLNEVEQETDTLPNAFVFSRGGTVVQPQVFSVSPAAGPNGGGTRVSLNGEGFQAPVQVFFGQGTSPDSFSGIEATVESVTPSRVVVTTPPAQGFGQNNLNQVVDILVRNLQSGFATIAPSAFQYGAGGADVPFISAISPGQGLFSGGDLITLFGQGFDAPVAVELAGVGQQIVSVTGTEVVVRTVPVDVTSCGDISGPSQLTNIETGESAEGPIFVYRVPRPVITGVSPPSGPQSGSTLVTVQGQGFTNPARVEFGDQAANIESLSADGREIRVRTPVFSGELATEACGDGGERFVPTAVDVTVTNLATTCTDTFSNGFVFNPTDTSCRNEEEPEPVEPQCSDGLDNDGDGLTDYNDGVTPPGDPECTSDGDDNEAS